jgi:hypothetical protein
MARDALEFCDLLVALIRLPSASAMTLVWSTVA